MPAFALAHAASAPLAIRRRAAAVARAPSSSAPAVVRSRPTRRSGVRCDAADDRASSSKKDVDWEQVGEDKAKEYENQSAAGLAKTKEGPLRTLIASTGQSR